MKSKNRSLKFSDKSTVYGVIVGAVAAMITGVLIMTGVTSLLIHSRVREHIVGLSIFLIRVIATLVGVMIGTNLTKEKTIVTSGAISAAFLVILTGLGIIFYDESFRDLGLCVLSIMIGGVIGCLFRLKLQNKPIGKKKIRV